MTLFGESEPEVDKMEKELKWLNVQWWLEDHAVRIFLIAFVVVILLTCGGC